VELAALRSWSALGELDGDSGWDAGRWEAELTPYFAAHAAIGTGAGARSGDLVEIEEGPGRWRVRQVLDDPEGFREWAIVGEIDLDASDAGGEAVLRPVAVSRL